MDKFELSRLQSVMKSQPELVPKEKQLAHQRIAIGLRSQILNGKFEPGIQLPSTEELAATWQASCFTVHTAVSTLAKEGWVERRHGSGTYVADPKHRFLCAGIYQDAELGSVRASNFMRNLHFSILKRLEQAKKRAEIFIDSRPEKKQVKILPAVTEAIRSRRIQCLIAPTITSYNMQAVTALSLPTAFIRNPLSPNQASIDLDDFSRSGVRRLAQQGCRSVGIISSVFVNNEEDSFTNFYKEFQKTAREEGVDTRKQWIRKPARYVLDEHERYGYQQMLELWKLREKPQGLLVYPDVLVRGAITALLKLQVDIPGKLKVVFHRNAHVDVLCPFTATWAISDEDVLAKGLIDVIEMQFRGEKVTPLLFPHRFEEDAGI